MIPEPAEGMAEGEILAPDEHLAPLLPPGTWQAYPAPADQTWPKIIRPDRPQILWRPSDGTVAVPALRDGTWLYALISRQDAAWVLASNWFISKAGYVVCNQGGKQPYLHRLVKCAADNKVFSEVPAAELVDHKNVIPTDCRRRNLRWSNQALNQQNIGKEHPGITWNEYRQRWTARITWQGRDIHVCYSRKKSHAIRMRKQRAAELGIPLNGDSVAS